jgi:hypothetical protein
VNRAGTIRAVDDAALIFITGAFPILAWIGFIGFVVAFAKKWPRQRAIAFAAVGIIGLAGMAWTSLTIFSA